MLIFNICFWTTRKDVADPKVAENKIFDAVGYGKCKIECYTKQSYIRQVLGHGKFKSIISSCEPVFHSRVCFRLVEHVKQGKSRELLWTIRDKITKDLAQAEDVA